MFVTGPSLLRVPFAFACALALAAVAACTHADHPLSPPASVEGFCGPKQVRETALLSIMTSTSDKAVTGARPPAEAELRARLLRTGGALGRWDDEMLRLPQTARALGEADAFARVRAAVAVDAPEGATTRPLYLFVRDHGSYRWIELTAFDVQSVCVEGRRSA
jgi:hypothetical protein